MIDLFNDFFKFGTDVKSRAGLYSLMIIFFTSVGNLFLGIQTLSIYLILESFVVCILISLIEYFLFLHYEELSSHKKNLYTVIWAISANIILIFAAIAFNWYRHYPTWLMITLLIVMEIALIFFRYSIYAKNYYDTKQLNEKLYKFQNQK